MQISASMIFDEVILVGGSTRIFVGKELINVTVKLDEVVALIQIQVK